MTDPEPDLDALAMPTAEDVVDEVNREVKAWADHEEHEAAVAAVINVIDVDPPEEEDGFLSARSTESVPGSEDEEELGMEAVDTHPVLPRAKRGSSCCHSETEGGTSTCSESEAQLEVWRKSGPEAEPEAEPADAAASTRGGISDTDQPKRREYLATRILVERTGASSKYIVGKVLPEQDSVEAIHLVLEAREEAMMAEGDDYGARSLREAKRILEQKGRIRMVRGDDQQHKYLVFDFALQKRTILIVAEKWAATEEGQHLRYKSTNKMIPVRSHESRFGLHREFKKRFRGFCDQKYGGDTWLRVLCQMGACPSTFVDAWNAVIDDRLAAVNLPRLDAGDGDSEPRPRDPPMSQRDSTRYMRNREKSLMFYAAHLAWTLPADVHIADASTLGEDDFATLRKIESMHAEAAQLRDLRMAKLNDRQWYQTHPPTHHAAEASGAKPNEPEQHFPKALRRTLMALGVPEGEADALIGAKDEGEGATGRRGGSRREPRGRGGREPRGGGSARREPPSRGHGRWWEPKKKRKGNDWHSTWG